MLPDILRGLRARLCRDEDGIAMFAALLAILILSGLATLFLARTVTESRASGDSRNRETSIHAAEASADEVLSNVNVQTTAAPFITTAPGGAPHVFDPATITTPEAEKAWAIAQADAAVAADPSALLTTREGQAYGIRPEDPAGDPVDVIFGVGWVPSYDSPNAKLRVVKYQIDEDLFTPRYALLAGEDLNVVGGGSILAPGCATDPALCDADVHVNGALTGGGTAEGRVSVAGGPCSSIAATGGCAGQGAGVVEEPVPDIEARDFYNREVGNLNPAPNGDPTEWFDLCPDGRIRAPSAAGPCDPAATVIWDQAGNTTFNGWTWRPSQNQWRATNSLSSGLYYVYGADAVVNGTSGRPTVSIFVERIPSRLTDSGTLTIGGGTKMNAAFPDVQFVVDADIKFLGGGGTELGGFITAREQMDLGGTVDLEGALIIQDRTDTHPEVTRGNGKIHGDFTLSYNRNLQIDLTGVWTITFWNEL